MAIDTRNKRDSAVNVGLPWRGRLPVPDGSLATAADRKHVSLLYRGEDGAGPVVVLVYGPVRFTAAQGTIPGPTAGLTRTPGPKAARADTPGPTAGSAV